MSGIRNEMAITYHKNRKEMILNTRTGDSLCTGLSGSRGDEAIVTRCGVLVKSGILLIKEEQHRQEQEAGSVVHDECRDGKLALVAACYAEFALLPDTERVEQVLDKDPYWPWDEVWWKPKSALEDLVHAGALIATEIDRLLSAEPVTTGPVTEG